MKEVYPFNYRHTKGVSGTGPVVAAFDCASHDKAGPGTCAWAALKLGSGKWVNATVSAHGSAVKFTPDAAQAAARPSVASAYGWGSVPMMSLYDTETDLPVIGWNETV